MNSEERNEWNKINKKKRRRRRKTYLTFACALLLYEVNDSRTWIYIERFYRLSLGSCLCFVSFLFPFLRLATNCFRAESERNFLFFSKFHDFMRFSQKNWWCIGYQWIENYFFYGIIEKYSWIFVDFVSFSKRKVESTPMNRTDFENVFGFFSGKLFRNEDNLCANESEIFLLSFHINLSNR